METEIKVTGRGEDRLYQTIAEVLGISPETLSEESSPDTIPNWDSMNHLNLIMALESEFGIELSVEDALGMRNIGLIRTALRESGVEV